MAQELETLARLHERGELTDEEFARAKNAALKRQAIRPEDLGAEPGSSFGNAANRYVNFQIGMSIVGLVVVLLFLVLVFLPRLSSFPRP